MHDISDFMGYGTSPIPLRSVPWILMAISGPVWILGLAGIVRLRVRARGILSGILLVASLWFWSIPQTAAGSIYSMRVLLPGVALSAVAAGWIASTARPIRAALAVALGLISLDAARRAWLMPDDPLTTPWTLSFGEWRFFQAQDAVFRQRNIWPILAKAAAGGYIMVDNPQPYVATIAAGGHPTPLVSPRVAAAFDPSLTVEQALQRLRALHMRFLTFSVSNPVVNKLVQRHAFLRSLARDYTPAANLKGLLIFDLEFMSRKHEAPRAED